MYANSPAEPTLLKPYISFPLDWFLHWVAATFLTTGWHTLSCHFLLKRRPSALNILAPWFTCRCLLPGVATPFLGPILVTHRQIMGCCSTRSRLAAGLHLGRSYVSICCSARIGDPIPSLPPCIQLKFGPCPWGNILGGKLLFMWTRHLCIGLSRSPHATPPIPEPQTPPCTTTRCKRT